MIDQYKNETSQIHAPADLILKTKQAVREEEKRIEWEKAQQEQSVHRQTIATQAKSGYGKTYKWALPVAAAVLFVILMNVSTMMIGNRFTKSQSNNASDMAAGEADAGGAEYEFSEDDAAAEEYTDMDAGMDKAFADRELFTESAAAADEEGAAYDMYEDSVAEASEEAKYDDAENTVNESAMTGDAGENLSITEVEETPTFYDDPNTECITAHGLRFYVAREWENNWKAYVSIEEVGYVITGDVGITDRESFVEKAYELLAETVEGIE